MFVRASSVTARRPQKGAALDGGWSGQGKRTTAISSTSLEC